MRLTRQPVFFSCLPSTNTPAKMHNSALSEKGEKNKTKKHLSSPSFEHMSTLTQNGTKPVITFESRISGLLFHSNATLLAL